jgi:hypothetical protein
MCRVIAPSFSLSPSLRPPHFRFATHRVVTYYYYYYYVLCSHPLKPPPPSFLRVTQQTLYLCPSTSQHIPINKGREEIIWVLTLKRNARTATPHYISFSGIFFYRSFSLTTPSCVCTLVCVSPSSGSSPANSLACVHSLTAPRDSLFVFTLSNTEGHISTRPSSPRTPLFFFF